MNDTRQELPYCFFILDCIVKHLQSVFTLISLVILLSITFTITASAAEPSATNASATKKQLTSADAQKIWNKTCFTCHGDSEDIARNFLSVVDGELQGPMHKETFRTFLTNHYLSKIKADAVYSMLLTQATSKTRFEKECSSCHQKESDLVRDKLALHNGILYSRKSKKPVYGFLETHRDLSKKDVRFFMKKLTFLGYEIYQPVKMN
jgi:cytochrome c5